MWDYYEEDEGIHFGPEDDELINEYLIPKLKGDLHEDFIVHKNVYAKEPWLLDHNMDPFFQKNEWYYFVTRTQVSEKNIGCGKKVKRKIVGDNNDGIERGNWKANATTDILDTETKKIIGKKQTLTYTRSNNNKKQKGGDGTCVVVPGSDSSWIMTEYMLPEGENFQELVLCKIKKIKKKDDHHEASTSTSTSTSNHHHEASSFSSLEQQAINTDHEINKSKNKGDQLHINAPPVSRGHEISLATGSGEEAKDWIQYLGYRVDEINDHVSVQDPSSEKQPINEAHRDDSENLGFEKDNQIYNDAPLVCLESSPEWLKEFEESMLRVSGPNMLVEEEPLIYNTPWLDQDLRDQFAALCSTKTSQTC